MSRAAKAEPRRHQVEADVVLVSVCRRPQPRKPNFDVEIDLRGSIVIDDRFITSAPNIQRIGYVTFRPIPSHIGDEDVVAAVGYMRSGHILDDSERGIYSFGSDLGQ